MDRHTDYTSRVRNSKSKAKPPVVIPGLRPEEVHRVARHLRQYLAIDALLDEMQAVLECGRMSDARWIYYAQRGSEILRSYGEVQ